MVPLGRTLHVDHFDYCPSSLLNSKYTNRAIKLAVTSVARVRCPRSCRRTTLVKIFVEIISRMTCNSQNSRKFRPAKFKRYTVIPSHALFQRAWALLHGGNCDNSIIACLITIIPFYSIPFHSISFHFMFHRFGYALWHAYMQIT